MTTPLEKIVDFHTQKYLACEVNHIDHLYNDRPHRYAQLTRSQFVADVYIPMGLAENFRQYWFGERHLVRETPQHWGVKDIEQHKRGN